MSKVNYAKVSNFVDELGRQVTIFSHKGTYETAVINGKNNKPVTIVKGVALVRAQRPNSQQTEDIPFEFTFPDNIKDAQAAYDVFDATMKEAIKEAQAKAKVQRASRMPNLLGPDGRPMG